MSVTISGASDDTIVLVAHDGVLREEATYTGSMTFIIREAGGGGGCWLRLSYEEMPDDSEGGWSASIRLLGEGEVIPWPIEVGHHPQRAYSVVVRIDCPDTATIDEVAS